MSIHRRIAATLMLLSAVTFSASPSAQTRSRDDDWTAPAKDASRVNPLSRQPDAESGGAKIFEHRCASCHGNDGRGTSKAPDLTQRDVQAQTDGALYWKISTGNTHAGMPTFSYLPELQRWQVVLHLRSLHLPQ